LQSASLVTTGDVAHHSEPPPGHLTLMGTKRMWTLLETEQEHKDDAWDTA